MGVFRGYRRSVLPRPSSGELGSNVRQPVEGMEPGTYNITINNTEIERTDKEIGAEVYRICGLTEEEIKTIEASLR